MQDDLNGWIYPFSGFISFVIQQLSQLAELVGVPGSHNIPLGNHFDLHLFRRTLAVLSDCSTSNVWFIYVIQYCVKLGWPRRRVCFVYRGRPMNRCSEN